MIHEPISKYEVLEHIFGRKSQMVTNYQFLHYFSFEEMKQVVGKDMFLNVPDCLLQVLIVNLLCQGSL